jgi:predicted metal-binding membrane protein
MTGHASHPQSLLFVVCMWQAMMMVMMLPVVLRWIAVMTTVMSSDGGRTARLQTGAEFVAGYFSVWLAYSVAASVAQITLQRAGWLTQHEQLGTVAGGATLMLAGLVQFTPLKRACLAHCRNPLGYFLTRWKNGPMRAIRLGMGHGSYCVGCCWALMATAFALGVMNVAWMAVLTGVACVEQLTPRGDVIGRVFGVALAAYGSFFMLG